MSEHLLGIDTGGTFTDFAYLHNGQLITHKRLSTPDQPEQAIFEGLTALGLDLEGCLRFHYPHLSSLFHLLSCLCYPETIPPVFSLH